MTRFWEIFWTVLLAGALALFAGLAVVVTIGGFREARALFRRLEARGSKRGGGGESRSEEEGG